MRKFAFGLYNLREYGALVIGGGNSFRCVAIISQREGCNAASTCEASTVGQLAQIT